MTLKPSGTRSNRLLNWVISASEAWPVVPHAGHLRFSVHEDKSAIVAVWLPTLSRAVQFKTRLAIIIEAALLFEITDFLLKGSRRHSHIRGGHKSQYCRAKSRYLTSLLQVLAWSAGVLPSLYDG
jgi:hypothetical protein